MADEAAILAKVPQLRETFLKKYDGSVLDDTYDERDVEWVKKDDRFLAQTLRCFKSGGDINKACEVLNECLVFRAKYGVNDLNEANMNDWYKKQNPIYFHGVDKQGYKLLIFDISKAKKGHLIEDGKKFIAWKINQSYKENPDQQIVVLYDFMNAGISNMDIDLAKFIVVCNAVYFPNFSSYGIMFKMGVALEAVWKIIQSFMDSDQKSKVKYAKRSNIQEYIAEDQLPERMKKPAK